MEMLGWTTRWKTKRCLWDSTLTAAVTVVLILQAVIVRAGKKQTPVTTCVLQAGGVTVNPSPAINFNVTKTQFSTQITYFLQTLPARAADICILKDNAVIKHSLNFNSGSAGRVYTFITVQIS